jgi:hypothetical protein
MPGGCGITLAGGGANVDADDGGDAPSPDGEAPGGKADAVTAVSGGR